MNQKIIYSCELCGKSQEETPLLSYPIETHYKNVMTEHQTKNEEKICLYCLEEQVKFLVKI